MSFYEKTGKHVLWDGISAVVDKTARIEMKDWKRTRKQEEFIRSSIDPQNQTNMPLGILHAGDYL
jgi:hypothetical protein